jgi:hypothetical protein
MHVWRVVELQTARIHFLINEVWYEYYITMTDHGPGAEAVS